ncbi:MAG: hypothetical protein ACOX7R_00465 [Acetivibrionales bacterium]
MSKKRKLFFVIIKNIVMIIVSFVVLIPILMVLINSFKDKRQASSMGIELPNAWHFENYAVVIEKGKLLQSFMNSVQYSLLAVVISILLASVAAFVLSRNRTKLNRVLYYIIIMGIIAMPINFVALMKVMQLLNIN